MTIVSVSERDRSMKGEREGCERSEGCRLCGGTAGVMGPTGAHYLCKVREEFRMAAPVIGETCKACNGSGRRSPAALCQECNGLGYSRD